MDASRYACPVQPALSMIFGLSANAVLSAAAGISRQCASQLPLSRNKYITAREMDARLCPKCASAPSSSCQRARRSVSLLSMLLPWIARPARLS